MFKSLLKTRLAAFGAYYSGAARRRGGKKKKSGTGSKVLYGLLMVYCFVVFVGMFFALFSTLAGAFGGTDFAWLYFTLYALMSFVLMFIGSVFMAKSQLFEAQDNELLLAMPVPPVHPRLPDGRAGDLQRRVPAHRGHPGVGGVVRQRIRDGGGRDRIFAAASGAESVHAGGDVPVFMAAVAADEPDA